MKSNCRMGRDLKGQLSGTNCIRGFIFSFFSFNLIHSSARSKVLHRNNWTVTNCPVLLLFNCQTGYREKDLMLQEYKLSRDWNFVSNDCQTSRGIQNLKINSKQILVSSAKCYKRYFASCIFLFLFFFFFFFFNFRTMYTNFVYSSERFFENFYKRVNNWLQQLWL